MQGGGCGAAAGYYGAPCGGQYRLGGPMQPAVGACGPSVGACGQSVGAYAGFARGSRRGLGSPEERRYLGSPEERYYHAFDPDPEPQVPYVGQRFGGGGGGWRGHGGHHGGFGRRGFGGGWWGGWGYGGWPYAYDYDYGYGQQQQCVYDQRTGRYVCYVWDPTRNAWVVVG